eukprot:GDKK01070589.1.p1 GENE.GDKK01070589.1~~GDKK01070589.1.p1  ORF type:complete len:505 (+),score=161.17 GDKK01070589.1:257-1771(+)
MMAHNDLSNQRFDFANEFQTNQILNRNSSNSMFYPSFQGNAYYQRHHENSNNSNQMQYVVPMNENNDNNNNDNQAHFGHRDSNINNHLTTANQPGRSREPPSFSSSSAVASPHGRWQVPSSSSAAPLFSSSQQQQQQPSSLQRPPPRFNNNNHNNHHHHHINNHVVNQNHSESENMRRNLHFSSRAPQNGSSFNSTPLHHQLRKNPHHQGSSSANNYNNNNNHDNNNSKNRAIAPPRSVNAPSSLNWMGARQPYPEHRNYDDSSSNARVQELQSRVAQTPFAVNQNNNISHFNTNQDEIKSGEYNFEHQLNYAQPFYNTNQTSHQIFQNGNAHKNNNNNTVFTKGFDPAVSSSVQRKRKQQKQQEAEYLEFNGEQNFSLDNDNSDTCLNYFLQRDQQQQHSVSLFPSQQQQQQQQGIGPAGSSNVSAAWGAAVATPATANIISPVTYTDPNAGFPAPAQSKPSRRPEILRLMTKLEEQMGATREVLQRQQVHMRTLEAALAAEH